MKQKLKKEKIKKSSKIYSLSNAVIFLVLVLFVFLTFNTNLQTVFGGTTNSAIYYGDKTSNKVSLMFNVYWGTEYLDNILEILKTNNITTTFFVGGQWVEKEPEMLQKIYNNGHEIGNHGYFHKDSDKLSYNQNKEEILYCHTLVSKTINYEMNLFAPPSGAYNKTTLNVASELGYKTIMWSKDTIDWRDKDAQLVYTRATTKVGGGDLILMHPTQHTLDALQNIIDYYNANNLQVVKVSENISTLQK